MFDGTDLVLNTESFPSKYDIILWELSFLPHMKYYVFKACVQ